MNESRGRRWKTWHLVGVAVASFALGLAIGTWRQRGDASAPRVAQTVGGTTTTAGGAASPSTNAGDAGGAATPSASSPITGTDSAPDTTSSAGGGASGQPNDIAGATNLPSGMGETNAVSSTGAELGTRFPAEVVLADPDPSTGSSDGPAPGSRSAGAHGSDKARSALDADASDSYSPSASSDAQAHSKSVVSGGAQALNHSTASGEMGLRRLGK